jgi:hypothetical protein
MYRDFLESAYGQSLQYRKRRDRQFEIWWKGSLQTKGLEALNRTFPFRNLFAK